MEHTPRLTVSTRPSHTDGLNVTLHRASASVWDRRGWNGSRASATATRVLIGGGGLALLLQGMRQKGFARAMMTGVGRTLAWWALTGDGEIPDARQWMTKVSEKLHGVGEDLVHDASADSFPASDAPSFTPTVGTGVRRGPQ
jgi:hypothetical protein